MTEQEARKQVKRSLYSITEMLDQSDWAGIAEQAAALSSLADEVHEGIEHEVERGFTEI